MISPTTSSSQAMVTTTGSSSKSQTECGSFDATGSTTPADEQFTFTRPGVTCSSLETNTATTSPSSSSSDLLPPLISCQSQPQSTLEPFDTRRLNDENDNASRHHYHHQLDDENELRSVTNSSSTAAADDDSLMSSNSSPAQPLTSSSNIIVETSLNFDSLNISSPRLSQKKKQRKFKQSRHSSTRDSALESIDSSCIDIADDTEQSRDAPAPAGGGGGAPAFDDQGYNQHVSSSISMEEASISSTLTVHSTASVASASTSTSHRASGHGDSSSRRSNASASASASGNHAAQHNRQVTSSSSNSGTSNSANCQNNRQDTNLPASTSGTASRCSSQIGGSSSGRSTNTRTSSISQMKRHSGCSEASIKSVTSNRNNLHINGSGSGGGGITSSGFNNNNNNNGTDYSCGDVLYESMIDNNETKGRTSSDHCTPIRSCRSTFASQQQQPPPLPPLLPCVTGTPKMSHASARLSSDQLLSKHDDSSANNQHLFTPSSSDNCSPRTSVAAAASASANDINLNGNNCITSCSNGNDSTIKKGLLWQMKDGGFFSRWKERYFILTKDYLTCFKKSSSNLSFLGSEMGSFAYKLKLVEVDSINWKSPSDCTGRSKIIPKSIRNKNKKNEKARRVTSSFSSGGVSSDGESSNDCGVHHDHHNFARYFSSSVSTSTSTVSTPGDNDTNGGHRSHTANNNNGCYNGHLDDQSCSTRSSNSSRSKSSSKASNGRQVISISIKNGSSHIDLWTSCDSSLDDWMNCLREASNHSKGRREALIRKSKTLCVPSPNHQPFALSSYWATASR